MQDIGFDAGRTKPSSHFPVKSGKSVHGKTIELTLPPDDGTYLIRRDSEEEKVKRESPLLGTR